MNIHSFSEERAGRRPFFRTVFCYPVHLVSAFLRSLCKSSLPSISVSRVTARRASRHNTQARSLKITDQDFSKDVVSLEGSICGLWDETSVKAGSGLGGLAEGPLPSAGIAARF